MNKRMVRSVILLGLISLPLAMAQTSQPAGATRTTESGLKIVEVKKLTEPLRAQKGDNLWVHYTVKVQGAAAPVDSSAGGQPLPFQHGVTPLIKGWEEGVLGMQVGEKRHLIVPPDLGYGAAGRPPRIPGNSTLEFDIELVGIQRPDTPPAPARQP